MGFGTKFALCVLGLLLAVGVFFGGRELDWWLRTDNRNRQVELDNRDLGTQTAWRDEAQDSVREFHAYPPEPEFDAARGVARNQACDLIGRLADSYVTDDLVAFNEEECV
jgi:hypothetical protein